MADSTGEMIKELRSGSKAGPRDGGKIGPLLGEGRTAEVFAWGDREILKLFRTDCPPDWITREAKVAQVLFRSGLKVPAFRKLIKWADRQGIIYERIDGPSMLGSLAERPWTFLNAMRQFTDLHLAIHKVNAPELPSQREVVIDLIENAHRISLKAKRASLKILKQLPDDTILCHGVFHPDNIILSPQGPVVIDWMSATKGNPLVDVAMTSLVLQVVKLPETLSLTKRWLFQNLRGIFHTAYLSRYFRLSGLSREQFDVWVPIMASACLSLEFSNEEEDHFLSIAENGPLA